MKYRKHTSILAIKGKTKSGPVFTFNHITKKDDIKEIKNLDASKASQEHDIPIKIIKGNSAIFPSFIYQSFNNMIDVCIFPTLLKLAITTVYKKGLKEFKGKLQAGKYLPRYLKNLRKVSFKQILNYFENIFSKFQCGFKQGLSTQYCLISMIEK